MNIQKRPNGKWRARYRDDAGREHARHFTRKVDAQRWLDEVTTSRVTGQYVDPGAGRITFADFYQQWKARQVWTESTTTTADRAAEHVPFAAMPVGKIRTSHVQEWVREMIDRPLAASTVVARFNYVHMVFRGAVADRRITEAPSAGVRLPKAKSAGMVLPTVEQVGQALSMETWFRGFVAVCAFAGLRQGEAAGLQVGDVDWLGRVIRVRRQIVSNAGYVHVRDPKYGQRRDIPAPSDLLDLLAGHVETYSAHGDEQWLFWSSGRVVTRAAAGHQWRRLRDRYPGMEGITLHDLRHFYASGLIADGCDVVTVQKALGHSKPSITLDVYSHLWPRAEDRTRGAADRLMGSVADSLRTPEVERGSD